MDLSKKSFDEFWEICQNKLNVGMSIPNWSAAGNVRVNEFQIESVSEAYISFRSQTAKNVQIVDKRDFRIIYNIWEDYKSRKIPRFQIRNFSTKSTYVIATIRYVETYS